MSAKFKSMFFDRQKVINAMDAASRRALSKAGAFIRTRARSSIRKRRKIATAGSPPSSHEGSLKRLIFFGYDLSTRSVVIGPEKYRNGEAPNLLEFGGTVTRRDRAGVTKTLTYAPRPFMGPAMATEVAKGTIPSCWANSVRG